MSTNPENTPEEPTFTLVLGVDGSGKTTFLNNITKHTDSVKLEPTSSVEAQKFKREHIDVLIDEAYVDAREALFLGINNKFDGLVSQELAADRDVYTSGSALITLVAHGLMRSMIGRPNLGIDDVVDAWLETDGLRKPQELVFLHAPDRVIRRRLENRQQQGIAMEQFRGFNSLDFLSRYQETWHGIVERLSQQAILRTTRIDTSSGSADFTLGTYLAANYRGKPSE